MIEVSLPISKEKEKALEADSLTTWEYLWPYVRE